MVSGEQRVAYHGTGATFFGLVFRNLLFTVLTLGVYGPWARTERRRYLLESTEFDGHRFRYHGTGRELLIGFLKVVAGYLVLIALPVLITRIDRKVGLVAQLVGVLVLLPLIPIAIYGARRYLLGRTGLRGIRFGLEPGAAGFLARFAFGVLATILTLGLYAPVVQNGLRRYVVERMRYGSGRFGYDGENRTAWVLAMKGMFLSVVTLGLYYPWFLASVARFHAESTTFQGARFRLDIGGKDVFWILFFSIVGGTLSLGIAVPWIVTYVLETVLSKLTLEGRVDYARIMQRDASGDAVADGLATALDVGLEV